MKLCVKKVTSDRIFRIIHSSPLSSASRKDRRKTRSPLESSSEYTMMRRASTTTLPPNILRAVSMVYFTDTRRENTQRCVRIRSVQATVQKRYVHTISLRIASPTTVSNNHGTISNRSWRAILIHSLIPFRRSLVVKEPLERMSKRRRI